MPTLAVFTVLPESCVSGEPESDWKDALNGLFHQAFGWGGDVLIDGLIQHGRFGLDGFVQFIRYFVEQQGLVDWCINKKIQKIMQAIDAK